MWNVRLSYTAQQQVNISETDIKNRGMEASQFDHGAMEEDGLVTESHVL